MRRERGVRALRCSSQIMMFALCLGGMAMRKKFVKPGSLAGLGRCFSASLPNDDDKAETKSTQLIH